MFQMRRLLKVVLLGSVGTAYFFYKKKKTGWGVGKLPKNKRKQNPYIDTPKGSWALLNQVTSLKSAVSLSGLFTGMVKYIMKFYKETGKTAKLVQQSG